VDKLEKVETRIAQLQDRVAHLEAVLAQELPARVRRDREADLHDSRLALDHNWEEWMRLSVVVS